MENLFIFYYAFCALFFVGYLSSKGWLGSWEKVTIVFFSFIFFPLFLGFEVANINRKSNS